MENGYKSNSTVTLVYESSGVDGFFVSDSSNINSSTALPSRRPAIKREEVVSRTVWFGDFNDTTTDSRSIMADGGKNTDVTNLLQTHLLLIAVLIVCFITLASVIAICSCMIRRYCKKRVRATGIIEAAVFTKSTSTTGLNLPCDYYSTKVAKNDDFSPIIAQEKCEKAISCELSSEVSPIEPSESLPLARKLDATSLSDQRQSDNISPLHLKMQTVLTSTPAANNAHCDGGSDNRLLEDQALTNNNSSSPHSIDAVEVLSSQSSNCGFTTAFGGEYSVDGLGSDTNDMSERGATQVPLSQSVSWFVSLKGNQPAPIRHSIIETTHNELNVKNYRNHLPDKTNSKVSSEVKSAANPEHLSLYDLNRKTTSSSNPHMIVPTDETPKEDAPLIKTSRSHSTSAPNSTTTKRSRLMSAMTESSECYDATSFCNRSQSFSLLDDSNVYKKREDRPVLFLGSGIK